VEDFDDWYVVTRSSIAPALGVWCGGDDVASDALDEAFVRAVERWEHVRSLASPTGWVWRTAVNVARRRGRRRGIEQRLWLHRSADGGVGKGVAVDADLDLRAALRRLTGRQRTAIVLFYLADLPVKEVGEIMGTAPGTVAATLHQARGRLGELLSEQRENSARCPDRIDGMTP